MSCGNAGPWFAISRHKALLGAARPTSLPRASPLHGAQLLAQLLAALPWWQRVRRLSRQVPSRPLGVVAEVGHRYVTQYQLRLRMKGETSKARVPKRAFSLRSHVIHFIGPSQSPSRSSRWESRVRGARSLASAEVCNLHGGVIPSHVGWRFGKL